MIGLILGTSEGKTLLSLLNEFTEDIFISTATTYGGELLKDYKYKHLNTTQLDLEGIKKKIIEYHISILIDASHPYALEVTKNAIEACKQCNSTYFRYDRPSIVDKYIDSKNVVLVHDYEDLYNHLSQINGTILNTTGSRNIKKIIEFKLPNLIIHRVLPTLKVMEELYELEIKPESIVAIKGPISYELNMAFIREHKAKAIITKDSGVQGGTEEKINAAIDSDIKIFVLDRSKEEKPNEFNSPESLISFIKQRYF